MPRFQPCILVIGLMFYTIIGLQQQISAKPVEDLDALAEPSVFEDDTNEIQQEDVPLPPASPFGSFVGPFSSAQQSLNFH